MAAVVQTMTPPSRGDRPRRANAPITSASIGSSTTAMEKAGIKSQFVQGMRVTDEETMKCAETVLGNVINRDIVELIQKLGGKARGFSGKDVFKCRQLEPKLGYVGEVTEVTVEKIRRCLYTQVVPVISPIGVGDDGHAYNINADVAAAKLAMTLGARRLVFLSDVPGLLRTSDARDVLTGLHGPDEVRRGFGLLTGAFGSRLAGVIVQPMVTGGVEVMISDGAGGGGEQPEVRRVAVAHGVAARRCFLGDLEAQPVPAREGGRDGARGARPTLPGQLSAK